MGLRERFRYEITSLNPEVTGSCHLITVHYPDGRMTNFIVDSGLYQEAEYSHLNDRKLPFSCEKIKFVLITHNHADHMGRLPYLVRSGFQGPIYATTETTRLMKTALRDSFGILKDEAERRKRKPPYDETDLQRTFEMFMNCEFDKEVYIDKNIKVYFFMNGHLLGAAMILIKLSYPGEKDINLLFMGDYKPNNKLFQVKDMPSWVYDLPITVVTESTYGNMDTKDIIYRMEKDFEEYTKKGYTIIASAFAQGRAQEELFMIAGMQKDKRINPEIPIGLDGNLPIEFTRLYSTSKLLVESGTNDFLPENFSFITKDSRGAILKSNEQMIIITSSGMLDHGPAKLYLERYVHKKNVLIYIPGYTAPDTLGYKLQHPENGYVKINGEMYLVRATVISTSEASSHAKADQILAFLKRFTNLQLVLINHGQKDVMPIFEERVIREVDVKHTGILGRHTFVVCHSGYMKHMNSKIQFDKTKKEIAEELRMQAKKDKKSGKNKKMKGSVKFKKRRVKYRLTN